MITESRFFELCKIFNVQIGADIPVPGDAGYFETATNVNLILSNPLNAFNNITALAADLFVQLPAMNVVNSLAPGETIVFFNPGEIAYQVRDASSNPVIEVQPDQFVKLTRTNAVSAAGVFIAEKIGTIANQQANDVDIQGRVLVLADAAENLEVVPLQQLNAVAELLDEKIETKLPLDGSVAMTGLLDLAGDAVSALNPVTFQQFQAMAAGLDYRDGCRVATTTALNATYSNGVSGVGATLTNAGTQVALVIDGVSIAVNDRVLIKDQVNAVQNGIYTVTNIGSGATNWVLTRATDYDNSPSGEILAGTYTNIIEGTINAGVFYFMRTPGAIIVGTSLIVFSVLNLIVPGIGLGLTAPNTLFIANTTVAPGTKGSASKSVTATVNQQGQLTGLNDQDILILPAQVDGLADLLAAKLNIADSYDTITGNYTLFAADAGKIFICDSPNDFEITLPQQSFRTMPGGFNCRFININSGNARFKKQGLDIFFCPNLFLGQGDQFDLRLYQTSPVNFWIAQGGTELTPVSYTYTRETGANGSFIVCGIIPADTTFVQAYFKTNSNSITGVGTINGVSITGSMSMSATEAYASLTSPNFAQLGSKLGVTFSANSSATDVHVTFNGVQRVRMQL